MSNIENQKAELLLPQNLYNRYIKFSDGDDFMDRELAEQFVTAVTNKYFGCEGRLVPGAEVDVRIRPTTSSKVLFKTGQNGRQGNWYIVSEEPIMFREM